jgi:hypothetical protein
MAWLTGARTIEGRITYLGFLNDPNDLAMTFLMGLPLTLFLAQTAGSFILRYLSYAAAGVTLYGIYLAIPAEASWVGRDDDPVCRGASE